MCPQIKTHELNEIVGHIKRRTYVDRYKFDSNVGVTVRVLKLPLLAT